MKILMLPFVIGLVGLVMFLILVAFRRLGEWNRTYVRLGDRYCGQSGRGGVTYGILFSKPGLSFDYGRTYCYLRNRKSFRFATRRQTELVMDWPDRKFRLEISTSPIRSRQWGAAAMKPVVFDDPQFQADFHIAASHPPAAKRLLTGSVQWQIEQLRELSRTVGGTVDPVFNELQISISRGNLVISKPGYIKRYEALDDFVRLGLEFFDQLMLGDSEGIEFLNDDQAMVVESVSCPICSEEIAGEMVICTRCKTPHCKDCWQYNGQCATFACNETRWIPTQAAASS